MHLTRRSARPNRAGAAAIAVLGCGLFLGAGRPAAAEDAKGTDFAAGDPAKVEKADLEKVQAYLATSHPKVKNANPKRQDSPAIRKSYPNHRFYVIQMEFPRGAWDPDWEKKINLVVSLDAAGNVVERSDGKSFQAGLVAVTDDAGALTAAAAIMSLQIPLSGYTVVKPEELKMETKDGVRVFTARTERNSGYYQVEFDGDGKCIKAYSSSTQKPPP